MNINFIGNFYLQHPLNSQELSYLNAFSSSSHFNCSASPLMGLYDVSVTKEMLSQGIFSFDQDLESSRTSSIDSKVEPDLGQTYVLFPFFKSPVVFTEKAIKFTINDIKGQKEFLFFMEYLSKSILFYYHHFLKQNCYSKSLDKNFFNFFQEHGFYGSVCFKLSEFGEIYKLTVRDDKMHLFKGTYPAEIRGKTYLINSNMTYERTLRRQLNSYYDKISMVDIKKKTIFEEIDVFQYGVSDELGKMLHFKSLSAQLGGESVSQSIDKDKVLKI